MPATFVTSCMKKWELLSYLWKAELLFSNFSSDWQDCCTDVFLRSPTQLKTAYYGAVDHKPEYKIWFLALWFIFQDISFLAHYHNSLKPRSSFPVYCSNPLIPRPRQDVFTHSIDLLLSCGLLFYGILRRLAGTKDWTKGGKDTRWESTVILTWQV